jgi:ABC-type sugar transport system ATPase subunit
MMIKFENVTVHYHYDDYPVFRDLSFAVEKNKTTTLLMERQSGKTTIAKLLTGLTVKKSGRIIYDGKDIEEWPIKERGIAYFPKEPLFFHNKSVLFNLTYPLTIRGCSKEQAKERINNFESKFDLLKKAKKLSKEQIWEMVFLRAAQRDVKLVILDDIPSEYYPLSELIPCATRLVLTSDKNKAIGEVVKIEE